MRTGLAAVFRISVDIICAQLRATSTAFYGARIPAAPASLTVHRAASLAHAFPLLAIDQLLAVDLLTGSPPVLSHLSLSPLLRLGSVG